MNRWMDIRRNMDGWNDSLMDKWMNKRKMDRWNDVYVFCGSSDKVHRGLQYWVTMIYSGVKYRLQ